MAQPAEKLTSVTVSLSAGYNRMWLINFSLDTASRRDTPPAALGALSGGRAASKVHLHPHRRLMGRFTTMSTLKDLNEQ